MRSCYSLGTNFDISWLFGLEIFAYHYVSQMGSLRNLRSDRAYHLSSHNLVGRAPGCTLHLQNPLVSGHHAELRWTGSGWELHDLDSRNGTFVGDAVLSKGERRKLLRGALIAFGDPEDRYELVNDDAPLPSARSSSGRLQESQSGALLLPDADSPQCLVLQERGQWLIEAPDGSVVPARSGQTITIHGDTWTLDLPDAFEPTRQIGALSLETAILRFSVSRDEEHVELELIHGTQRLRLPPRSYWYTLLVLARYRLQDRASSVSEAEEGWLDVEELVERQLHIDTMVLYQHVCRAKRALAREGIIDGSRIVERRPTARKIRIGARNIEIVTL